MKIENLEIGRTYGNYKELCDTLGIKSTGGNTKKKHIKELERYCTYHNEGYSFIIDEVYNTPKPKIDNRGGSYNTVEYIESIEKLILDLLVQDRNRGKVFLSKHKLFKELEMININYSECKKRIPKLSEFMNINQVTIREWYDSTSSMLERNLNKALKNLEDQFLIDWSREVTVCIVKTKQSMVDIIKEITQDEYDEEVVEYKIQGDVKKEFREATDEERSFIFKTERETMLSLGCKNKQDIIRKKLWNEFDDTVKEIIFNRFNIVFHYKSYKILCNEEHIYEKWSELQDLVLEDVDREKEQASLNKSIIKNIHQNATNRQANAQKRKSKMFGNISNNSKINMRTEDGYIDDMNKLNDSLIDKNSKNIIKDVRKVKL